MRWKNAEAPRWRHFLPHCVFRPVFIDSSAFSLELVLELVRKDFLSTFKILTSRLSRHVVIKECTCIVSITSFSVLTWWRIKNIWKRRKINIFNWKTFQHNCIILSVNENKFNGRRNLSRGEEEVMNYYCMINAAATCYFCSWIELG